ncbi:MAG: M48 family metallopeptidase [bacterium]
MSKNKKKSPESIAIPIEGVGPVLFKKSLRAKYLNIRIKRFDGVHVSIPKGMSLTEAEEIVHNKVAWIKKQQQRIKTAEKESLIYDGSQIVKTRSHQLQVQAEHKDKFVVKLETGLIKVHYPAYYKITDTPVQTAIQRGLTVAYRREAKEYLPKRVDLLARKHGFEYNQVFIKNHKSRWGSCSAKNNINLNLHLMRLPDDLIDYVILHELVHTQIKNHGAAFWVLLDEVCSDVKKLKQRMREYDIPH